MTISQRSAITCPAASGFACRLSCQSSRTSSGRQWANGCDPFSSRWGEPVSLEKSRACSRRRAKPLRGLRVRFRRSGVQPCVSTMPHIHPVFRIDADGRRTRGGVSSALDGGLGDGRHGAIVACRGDGRTANGLLTHGAGLAGLAAFAVSGVPPKPTPKPLAGRDPIQLHFRPH